MIFFKFIFRLLIRSRKFLASLAPVWILSARPVATLCRQFRGKKTGRKFRLIPSFKLTKNWSSRLCESKNIRYFIWFQCFSHIRTGVGKGPGVYPGKISVPGTESWYSLVPETVPQSWVLESLVPQIWVSVPVPDPGFQFWIPVPVANPGFSDFVSRSQSRILKWVPIPDFRDRYCEIPGKLSRIPTPVFVYISIALIWNHTCILIQILTVKITWREMRSSFSFYNSIIVWFQEFISGFFLYLVFHIVHKLTELEWPQLAIFKL